MHQDFTFAHAGINVEGFEEISQWYVENLGCRVARSVPGGMTFLADPTGRVILELYSNPDGPVLPFKEVNFLSLHLAFLVEDPKKQADRLLQKGASLSYDAKTTPAGDTMVMLQDPWGISIQLIRRAVPMF